MIRHAQVGKFPLQVYLEEIHNKTFASPIKIFCDNQGCFRPPTSKQIKAYLAETNAAVIQMVGEMVRAYRIFPLVIAVTLFSLVLWEFMLNPNSSALDSLSSGAIALSVVLGYYYVEMKKKSKQNKARIESAVKIMTALSPIDAETRSYLMDIAENNNKIKILIENIKKEKRMITLYEAGELINLDKKEKKC